MLDRLAAIRIVARPDALDTLEGHVLRLAPDEALVLGTDRPAVGDPYAIISDDTGWRGVWLEPDRAERFFSAECDWPRPTERPAFAQGMIAHLPVKLWLETDRVLVAVPHVFAADLTDRLGT